MAAKSVSASASGARDRLSRTLPVKTVVMVEIYDVSGGRVARLVDGEEDRGPHVAEWRGLDDRGRPVASGVYFYRLRAGKETISKKMVLLR